MVAWSRGLLFQPVFMVQPTEDRMRHHAQVLREPVPMCVQRSG